MIKIKIAFIGLVFSTFLFAQNISVTSNWQLLGAMENIDASKFDNRCVDFVWKYTNSSWQIYIANDNNYTLPSTVTEFSSINSGEGFWIKGNSSCVIDTNQDTATQDTYSVAITAVDGYIKDALLKDSVGNIATYSGSSGKYIFNLAPIYPLTLSGGVLEDANIPFDINLTLKEESASVISPISTFIDGDADLQSRITSDFENYSVNVYDDYMEVGNLHLAELSQLFYALLKSDTRDSFVSSLKADSSIDAYSEYADLALRSLDNSNLNSTKRAHLKALIGAIGTGITSVNDFEDVLKAYKIIVSHTYKDPTLLSSLSTAQLSSFYAHDDGYYQKGISRSYTRENNTESVVDNATNLMWQDNEDAKTVQKTWEDAIEYCESLTLDGYSDWRLPSAWELKSIIDYSRYDPAIDSIFQNATSGSYWTSTTYISDSSTAWIVYFYYGYDFWDHKTDNYYIRCVRDNN